jgi:hypothetical protein
VFLKVDFHIKNLNNYSIIKFIFKLVNTNIMIQVASFCYFYCRVAGYKKKYYFIRMMNITEKRQILSKGKNKLPEKKKKILINILAGLFIYTIGDTVAALLLGEYSILRVLGISFVGVFIYRVEILFYFEWLKNHYPSSFSSPWYGKNSFISWKKTLLAVLYFNPLWIARHLVFIKLFSGQFQQINTELLVISFWAFAANLPFSLPANFFIQNKFSIKWRFAGSAVFSAIMTIYYALSEVIFG